MIYIYFCFFIICTFVVPWMGSVYVVPSLMQWRLSLLHGRLLLFLKLFQMYLSVSYHSCIIAYWGSPCQKGSRAWFYFFTSKPSIQVLILLWVNQLHGHLPQPYCLDVWRSWGKRWMTIGVVNLVQRIWKWLVENTISGNGTCFWLMINFSVISLCTIFGSWYWRSRRRWISLWAFSK